MSEERRKGQRFQSPGLNSTLSDGNSAFIVVVDDVSKTGMGVSQVPEDFDETVNHCFALINAPLEKFTLILKPRWVHSSSKGKFKRIGFHIDDPPVEWIEFVEGFKEKTRDESEREAARHRVLGLMAVISDGKTKSIGVVEDLSESGLRLTQLPPDFDESTGSCTAVVNSPTGDVHVSLHPCWIRTANKGMHKTIGFKIHNPPSGWQKLIEELEKDDGQLGFLVMGEDDEESGNNTP
ncbi:MAG: PilZ domain-containing protein [Desulfobulbus sp.]|jgi:hypothetical protein|nr:MAG: PilZ domain-containing protein [Desulfobulbus sp.]